MTLPHFDPNAEVLRLLELEHQLSKRHAGLTHRERALIAANKVGKSEGVGGYETVLHLTGRYPHWWKGRRFARPILAWAAGDTAKTARDIIQRILLGPVGEFGTGLIPGDLLVRTTAKPGVADAIEGVFDRHVSCEVREPAAPR